MPQEFRSVSIRPWWALIGPAIAKPADQDRCDGRQAMQRADSAHSRNGNRCCLGIANPGFCGWWMGFRDTHIDQTVSPETDSPYNVAYG